MFQPLHSLGCFFSTLFPIPQHPSCTVEIKTECNILSERKMEAPFIGEEIFWEMARQILPQFIECASPWNQMESEKANSIWAKSIPSPLPQLYLALLLLTDKQQYTCWQINRNMYLSAYLDIFSPLTFHILGWDCHFSMGLSDKYRTTILNWF